MYIALLKRTKFAKNSSPEDLHVEVETIQMDSEITSDVDEDGLFAEGKIPSFNGVFYTCGQKGDHVCDYPHDEKCDGTCVRWEGEHAQCCIFHALICNGRF